MELERSGLEQTKERIEALEHIKEHLSKMNLIIQLRKASQEIRWLEKRNVFEKRDIRSFVVLRKDEVSLVTRPKYTPSHEEFVIVINLENCPNRFKLVNSANHIIETLNEAIKELKIQYRNAQKQYVIKLDEIKQFFHELKISDEPVWMKRRRASESGHLHWLKDMDKEFYEMLKD